MARAALSRVIIAVPAEPVKPEMNCRRASVGAMYSEECASSEGTTKRGSSQSAIVIGGVGSGRTVDVYLVLFHELPQVGQAGGGVDFLHFERSAQSCRCCKGSMYQNVSLSEGSEEAS